MLTAKRLREVMHYDPETGVFTRLKNSRRTDLCGTVAGCPDDKGYIHIVVDGSRYKAHRLAWLYVTGEWPVGFIDHKDQAKGNNRFANLREATKAENSCNISTAANNTSGVRGVYFHKMGGKWMAYITAAGKRIHLGLHESIDEAKVARRAGELKYHGAFAPMAGANG